MLNANMLAEEMLAAIGGKVTKARRRAFEKLAESIVRHFQVNGVVLGTVTSGSGMGGTVVGKVT